LKRALVLVLFAAAGSGFAQTASAQYPLTVSVEGSRIETRCTPVSQGGSFCPTYLHLTVLVGGRHLELEGSKKRTAILTLADYKAKLVSDEHSKQYLSETVYELQYPDGTTEKFSVTGETK